MTKEEWQTLYNKLDEIHRNFEWAYSDYKNGRNKKVRTDAERKVASLIDLAERYLLGNEEAYNLLTGEQGSDYSRAINYEFRQPRYFSGDLNKLLKAIETNINITKS
jgi:predicted AAA+ superfamily ATPase